MKKILKICFGLFLIISSISCNDDNNFGFKNPQASFEIKTPQSGASIVIDSTNMNNVALTLVWDDTKSETYSVEFAIAETDFADPMVGGISGTTNISWTNGELNTFLLDELRLSDSVETGVDVRILSADGEYSNTITLLVTPYIVTVSQLSVNGTFNNFEVAQAIPMSMNDFNLFTATIELMDGDEFNFIESNVSGEPVWQETEANSGMLTKYGGVNLSGYDAGVYKMDVDLVNFTVNLTLIVEPKIAVPGNHQGWDPPSAPLLAASSATTTDYEGYVWLDGGHKFVGPDADDNFNWGNTDWGDDGSFSGLLLEDGETDCMATAGYYFIQVDTDALTYSEVQHNWGLIGSGTGSWDFDQDMTYDAGSGTWSITLDLSAEEIKFRSNDSWDWNYGDDGADGSLEIGGANIVVPAAGNYTVTLDLSVPRAYTYTLTLN